MAFFTLFRPFFQNKKIQNQNNRKVFQNRSQNNFYQNQKTIFSENGSEQLFHNEKKTEDSGNDTTTMTTRWRHDDGQMTMCFNKWILFSIVTINLIYVDYLLVLINTMCMIDRGTSRPPFLTASATGWLEIDNNNDWQKTTTSNSLFEFLPLIDIFLQSFVSKEHIICGGTSLTSCIQEILKLAQQEILKLWNQIV